MIADGMVKRIAEKWTAEICELGGSDYTVQVESAIREALREYAASEWVDVRERIPAYVENDRKWYMVTDGKRCDIALLLNKHGLFIGHVLQFTDITHWKEIGPLPQAPAGAIRKLSTAIAKAERRG